jgi:hypothetical protein
MGIRDTTYHGWQNINTERGGLYTAMCVSGSTIYVAGYVNSSSYYSCVLKKSTTNASSFPTVTLSNVDLYSGSAVFNTTNLYNRTRHFTNRCFCLRGGS